MFDSFFQENYNGRGDGMNQRSNYKTKPCSNIERGVFCPYGANCLYIHPGDQVDKANTCVQWRTQKKFRGGPTWKKFFALVLMFFLKHSLVKKIQKNIINFPLEIILRK